MTRSQPRTRAASSSPSSRPQPLLPVLLLLFVGSGCAALIYEVVWLQLLSLIIGSSAVSMGVLLATYMGGMSIGSLALPRIIPPQRHPLQVYATLEAGIGVLGLLLLFGLPYVGGLYTAIGGGGVIGFIVRGLVCALCLLPPTLLMGATLPAIARWVETTPEGVSWLGFFYGGNIAGAVTGALLAGFYLLRVHDMAYATYVAMAINFAVAAVGFGLSRLIPHGAGGEAGVAAVSLPPAPEAGGAPAMAAATPGNLAGAAGAGAVDTVDAGTWRVTAPDGSLPPGSGLVLVAIGLSGMTALAAEVVWTRLLSLMLGATVYTFSLILAAFLVGLGLGSGVGAFLARSLRHPRRALGWCQFLLMAGIAWAAYSLTRALPYWPINPWLSPSAASTFQVDWLRCLWVVLPAATLWGASFPIALAAAAARGQDPGRLVGAVYAANTVGAIVGALSASLVIIATLGTQQAERLLIAGAGLAAILMLVPRAGPGGVPRGSAARRPLLAPGLLTLAVTVGLGGLLAWSVAPVPGLLVAYGRYMATRLQDPVDVIYVGEGMNSSLAVSRLPDGTLNYHNAGKVQASSEPQDMRLQRMLGHITTLVPEHPRSVLVIGFGAGVTAGAVSLDPAVERETIAEIEPLVPRVVSKYFSEYNFAVATNPKVHLRIDDARHYLLTTPEKFDAITSDPFDPWVKGAATLYTREFFELMKRHLNPGGVVTVFVQLYESNVEAVKSEIATFMAAFPNGIVWANTQQGQGYDLVLSGQVEPTRIDLDAIDARLQRPEYGPVARSLAEVGFRSAEDLFATYAGRGPDLAPWLADAQINRDRNLRLQYLAGLGLNLYQADEIYRELVAYRIFPDDLFTGSAQRLYRLRSTVDWGQ